MRVRKALVVIVWRSGPGASNPKVLLLKLNPDRGGFWQPVTGSVEEGESFAEGALREAEEETGLRFDRQPQYLGLETNFPSRHGGEAIERAFFLPLFGEAPPTPVLDGKEHCAYEWVSPAEALLRLKFEGNRAAVERASTGSPPLLFSRRGTFFQDGEEITHARTLALLHRSVERKSSGAFTVKIGSEELDLIVEDNPLVALSFDGATGEIALSDGTREVLKPETLRVRADHSFTCTVARGWEATFLPAAYYEISKSITESVTGEYVLHFLGRDYDLAVPSEGEGMDR